MKFPDTSLHDRRHAKRMKDPEYRAAYERAQAELARELQEQESLAKLIHCPKCGSHDWQAVEEYSCLTPLRLYLEDGNVEQEFDMQAELSRDAATSITTLYICATEGCGFSIEPLKVADLGGCSA